MQRHLACLLLMTAAGCGQPVKLAPDQRVEPLYLGGPASSWSSHRSNARLEREFAAYDLERLRGPDDTVAVRWRFKPKSITYSDVFLGNRIGSGFRAIRLRINNTGPQIRLAIKLTDDNGAEWTVEPTTLTGPGWRDVTWSRQDFRVAGWSRDRDGRLDLPARDLAVIAFELAAGWPYELWIQRVDVIRDVVLMPGLRMEIPDKIRADQPVPITMHFFGPPQAAPWWIDLTLDGRQVVRRKLGMLESGQPVAISLPRYLAGGRYGIRPSLGDMPVIDERTGAPLSKSVTVEARPASADDTVVEVRPHRGVPTLFVNGRPDSCMVYMTYRPGPRHFVQFGRAGVRLFSFSSTPTASDYGLSPTTWVGPDTFDYSNLDQRALMLLDAVPDAYFFPRIYLFSPAWWDREHPDDLVMVDPGEGRPRPFARDGTKRAPSWASQAWREDTAEAIRRYIHYIEQTPYADRVIGYHLASGTTEEWMMWGANEDQWADYSPANVAAFRRWLADRYDGDAALRRAWHDETVTLAAAAIPTKAKRARTRFGLLRDPAFEQDVIDYTLYSSDLVADTIAYFARVVREATQSKKLVGVFYGYVLQLMCQRQQNAGHLALDKVLRNPDVDFITSPTSYAFRTPGSGYSHFMSLTDSVKLHGKLWIDENDIRTWLTPGPGGQYGRTDTYIASLKQEQRELASVLGQGCGQWWFDMQGGWFDDSRMMAQIADQKRIADGTLKRPRGPVAEIAVVVDDKSLAYLRPGNPLSAPLLLEVLPHLARTGAPLSYYALSDLGKMPKPKMIVFLNVFAPDEDDRRAIDALKRDGRVLVFFWAAGLYRNGRIDPNGVSDLVGMRVKVSDQRRGMRGRFEDNASLVAGIRDRSFGPDLTVAPSLAVEDPAATVLGRGSRGRTVLALRKHKDWTSVYAAGPVHSRELFRRLADMAGVHRYVDTPDVVYATQSLLGIACNRAGRRTIRLRQPAKVWELFSQKPVADDVTEFSIHVEKHGTALLLIEPVRP